MEGYTLGGTLLVQNGRKWHWAHSVALHNCQCYPDFEVFGSHHSLGASAWLNLVVWTIYWHPWFSCRYYIWPQGTVQDQPSWNLRSDFSTAYIVQPPGHAKIRSEVWGKGMKDLVLVLQAQIGNMPLAPLWVHANNRSPIPTVSSTPYMLGGIYRSQFPTNLYVFPEMWQETRTPGRNLCSHGELLHTVSRLNLGV